MTVSVSQGDCGVVIKAIGDASIAACVTDPPYALTQNSRKGIPRSNDPAMPHGRTRLQDRGFMGKAWDTGETAFDPAFWAEVLRVLKPGAHLIAFGGTRTYHRLACAIEDAGFEIRDQIGWLYGSGFPKSHDVSKGIDRAAGAEREVVGNYAVTREFKGREYVGDDSHAARVNITAPATDSARRWQGWGTALKPAFEPLVIAQKPYTPQQLLAILVPTIGELICKVVSSEKTATFLYGLLRTNGFWSIATSLNNYLAALSGQESRVTTETASSLTTDLRIL